jgi:tetratricopeptide (TPR) repeat protein
VQDEIAAAVVDQLQIKLLGAAPSAKPVDPRVYPLLLQAQALSDQGSFESRAASVTLARQVLDTAPDEARAWGLLARVYFNQVTWGELPAAEGVRLMKEAAEKAVALDPEDAGSHGTLARIAMDIDFDLPAAARHLKRALALEPGNLRAVNTAGILLSNIGRMDEALPMFEYRAAHDPANQAAHFNLGATYVLAGRFDDALASIRTAMRLSPDSAQAHSIVGMALLLGKHDAAGALEAFKSERHEVSRMQGLSVALHALGRSGEADAALKDMVDKFGKEQPAFVATVYAYRGEADAAFAWLDRAASAHDSQLAQLLVENLLVPLHGDPRWLPLLRRLGYAPEQLAKIELKVSLPQ